MALFGGRRDVSLFNTIAREFIDDIANVEVGVYKISLENTPTNIYGESANKFYHPPVLINCLIKRSDQQTIDTDLGPDVNRELIFGFLKFQLEEKQLKPEVGDVILWGNDFYEINAVVENQLVLGKDPDNSLSTDTRNFGSSFSILCKTHFTKVDKLNLIQTRS
jgi:hypothetical protein